MSDSVSERTRKVVNGALKDCITQHGPITQDNKASAVKRIVAQLRSAAEGTVLTGETSAEATVIAWKKRYDKLRNGHTRLLDRYGRAQEEIQRLRRLCEINGITHTTLVQAEEILEEMVPFKVDRRPRCKSRGDYLGDRVPCDLHAGHDGNHLWQKPMSFEEFEWTDERLEVSRAGERKNAT